MSPETKAYDQKMLKTIEVVKSNFASVRAGRANAGVLDRITVEYYGTPTPLNQVAAISSPDPRTLMIQPWDGSLLKAIEKAIQTSDLGINPQNDGRIIRLNFPQLTVGVSEAKGTKCPRCWMHSVNANAEGLCPRCAAVIANMDVEL